MRKKNNNNKNILMILKTNFYNDSRVLKEATSLVKNNYHVTILCLWDKTQPEKEYINGITVDRLKGIPSLSNTIYGKIKIVIAFSLKIFLFSFGRNFRFIHCHDLNTLPSGIILKWLSFCKKKVIYDSHEYQTECYENNDYFKKKLLITERFFIYFTDNVICVSNSIANEYVKLYKIKKPSLILNCPPYFNKTSPKNYFREKFNLNSNQMIFLYQGGFSKDRGIESTLDAFKKRKETDKVIIFMGYGILVNTIKLASTQYKNVFYHPAVSPDILLDYTTSANIGILLYKNTCLNHYYCLPNKFFEYTQAELPVLISDLYEMKNIVEKYKNGIWVEDDITKLEKAVEKITWDDITNYKKNIPKMKGIYNWEQQEKILLQIYNNLS